MTAQIIPFPRAVETHGVIHAYASGGGFEIGHESESGGSWGGFQHFDCPQAAKAAAYRLNRDEYGGRCAVHIYDSLRDALPDPRGY